MLQNYCNIIIPDTIDYNELNGENYFNSNQCHKTWENNYINHCTQIKETVMPGAA